MTNPKPPSSDHSKERDKSLIKWTNSSVLRMAGNEDPIDSISKVARTLVRSALESGWKGPPYDPFWLAEFCGIRTRPSSELHDARLVPLANDEAEIEYNPNRPANRIRFSLAHEIAHTLFPDWSTAVRNRAANKGFGDLWQLELLCNLAAAEIIMPVGPEEIDDPLSIQSIIQLSEEYAVSSEAALLRSVRLTDQPLCAFVAAANDFTEEYRIDYVVRSATFPLAIPSGVIIHKPSVLSECTAIGFTAKGREKWSSELPEFYIECIGIPAYPLGEMPRIAGIIRPIGQRSIDSRGIKFLQGDALEPRGSDFKIIAHIVNDATPNWGAGFARFLSIRYEEANRDFKAWVLHDRKNLSLGNSYFSVISDGLGIFHMVAQQGYGKSATPRIRYNALERCLNHLAIVAKKRSASVHMPRIGTGYAGGSWSVIRELIEDTLIKEGVSVTVYSMPGSKAPRRSVSALEEFVRS